MLYAITSYFNPIGYRRRLQNYRSFRAHLSVPLVTVELSFDGAFALEPSDADILVQISGGALLWQKERLLNVAIQNLPAEATKVAWLDCDIIFKDPDWAIRAERRLDEVNLLQLFSNGVDLGPNDTLDGADERLNANPAVIYCLQEKKMPMPDARLLGHKPRSMMGGLAWAAHRSSLDRIGLYDGAVVGGGDRAMLNAAFGAYEAFARQRKTDAAREAYYLTWAEKFHAEISGKIGYLPGRVYHLWHGDLANRRYANRHAEFAALGFDQDKDIFIGENGAWHWRRRRPEIESYFQKYLLTRAEDGAAPSSARDQESAE